MNEIIVSDEIKRLKEEITLLTGVLAALSEEKNYLEYVECPRILSLYMEKIGDYANRINAQELMIAELKFRIMVIQAIINRDETLDEEKLEEDVKQEYADYQKRLDEQFEEAAKAKEEHKEREKTRKENEERYEQRKAEKEKAEDKAEEGGGSTEEPNNKPSDDEELKDLTVSQKIKELYRRIVKKLHPDVNPDITSHELELLNKANDAYRDGDLEALEDIYDEVFGMEEQEIPESAEGIEQLKERIIKLKGKIAELRKEIEAIKAGFPYSEKDFLEDDKKVSQKQAEYNRIIQEYEQLIKELEKKLDELLDQLAGKIINEVREEKSRDMMPAKD